MASNSIPKIFIGYDSRQPLAFTVLANSIYKTASSPVSIVRLDINQLPIERKGLTEFTYTRYLVPYLCNYEGKALFIDADMLLLEDISELLETDLEGSAVGVVKEIEPFERPSLMLFDCAKCKKLTPDYIEKEVPQKFEWAESVKYLDKNWNHIVPYSGQNPNAKLVHYTQGIPCFEETESCEYANEWEEARKDSQFTVPWEAIMGDSIHKQRMAKTKVVFIHRGGTTMASYRYRCQIPVRNIEGFDISINGGEAQIVVFSKPTSEDLEFAKQIKGKCHIVVDFCDDHFNTELYREMYDLADTVVTPTDQFPFTSDFVIPDPYEFDEVAPHAKGDKLVWFGHESNYVDMTPYKDLPNLKIVTNKEGEGITHYTPENLHRALLEANIALLPTREGVQYKSPNRLINALRMGLFPVCSLHPAYKEFREFCWVGEIRAGLRWTRAFPEDINARVAEGQNYIRDKYSPKTIGKQWQSLLESI